MSEILTLQFGHFSNFVGAHLWNLQEQVLSFSSFSFFFVLFLTFFFFVKSLLSLMAQGLIFLGFLLFVEKREVRKKRKNRGEREKRTRKEEEKKKEKRKKKRKEEKKRKKKRFSHSHSIERRYAPRMVLFDLKGSLGSFSSSRLVFYHLLLFYHPPSFLLVHSSHFPFSLLFHPSFFLVHSSHFPSPSTLSCMPASSLERETLIHEATLFGFFLFFFSPSSFLPLRFPFFLLLPLSLFSLLLFTHPLGQTWEQQKIVCQQKEMAQKSSFHQFLDKFEEKKEKARRRRVERVLGKGKGKVSLSSFSFFFFLFLSLFSPCF